ncbi:MAG: DUF1428 domain-containing protein [Bacteriovoracaceae bacterium]|nr:DUF1428 domain-containing protein [Bacteriovoracaceae bacterium]
MARYVDGFVIPIKKTNMKVYKKMAAEGKRLWMKHGALEYYECYMNDFLPYGLGFKKMCKLKSGETAIFAFIVFKSKAHRNQVNKKVHAGMDMSKMPKMPFDMKKFAVAGCEVILYGSKNA